MEYVATFVRLTGAATARLNFKNPIDLTYSMTPPAMLIFCTESSRCAVSHECFNVASNGTKPSDHVHPLPIRTMAEVGIDIGGHRSIYHACK